MEYKIENVEEKLREIYPEKDAQRFANSFRIILDIQRDYCNTNTRLEDIDRELELLREHLKDKKEFINEIDNFLKRISFGLRERTNLCQRRMLKKLSNSVKNSRRR